MQQDNMITQPSMVLVCALIRKSFDAPITTAATTYNLRPTTQSRDLQWVTTGKGLRWIFPWKMVSKNNGQIFYWQRVHTCMQDDNCMTPPSSVSEIAILPLLIIHWWHIVQDSHRSLHTWGNREEFIGMEQTSCDMLATLTGGGEGWIIRPPCLYQ